MDGVRRAKACELLGKTAVRALIIEPVTAKLGPEIEVSIDELLSPHKDAIALTTVPEWKRWQAILDEVAEESYSPILIEEGTVGVRLEDVEVT